MSGFERPEVGTHQYSQANYETTGPVWMHGTIQECPVEEPDEMFLEGEGELMLLPGQDPLLCDYQYVPEPGTLAVLGIGGLGVLVRRKRR